LWTHYIIIIIIIIIITAIKFVTRWQ
jgi:hypothetical protein